jgi:hypothetical protein
MHMQPSAYDKNLAAKVLVLAEIEGSPGLTGGDLLELVEARCADFSRTEPAFDFVAWTGTTFWNLLASFAEKGYVASSGELPSGVHEWRTAKLRLTPRGASFLESAAAEARAVLASLQPRVRAAV